MSWIVPLSDLDLSADEILAVTEVLQSGWISMGERVSVFEKFLAEYLNVKYAFAVTNGTTALHLACASLGLGPGDEVILPSLTFVATANSILYTGASPVFADIVDLNELTISPSHIETLITPQTRAIVAMHYGGYLCNMEAILDLAQRHHLAVIEDAAHAPGAAYRGKMAGTFGDVGCFSFFANKNLVTGEGGAIVTDRSDLADRIRLMRSHGMTSLTWERNCGYAQSYDVIALGFNYRMDELRAALGIVQLNKLEANNRRRRALIQRYHQSLCELPAIHVPFERCYGIPAGHLFAIILSPTVNRDTFTKGLKEAGVQTSLHYPPVHLFDYYRSRFGFHVGMLPKTEYAGQHLVTLPLFPSMTDSQLDWVVKSVKHLLE